MCETESERCIDMKTPRNVLLSAFYKRSNAFDSVNRKLLVILTSITDELVENTLAITQEYGQEAKEELNSVIETICGLKYEIQTNKPLKKLTSTAPDAYFWNELIEKETALHGETTYFRAIWLLVECYMYRRIAQSFEETNLLKDYDPYRKRKEQLYHAGLPVMTEVGSNLLGFVQNCVAEKEEFISLLKLDLWGNRLDLALSLTHSGHSELLEIHALDSQILCDHSERIWEAVSDTKSSSNIIDMVIDNAGYELFTDLCLATYIISKNLSRTVRFYVKALPWFLSDVMTHDFHWIIDQLTKSENESLKTLGHRWNTYLEGKQWLIEVTDFWTMPYDYTCMTRINPELYKKLAEAKTVIFKGDQNYRKLFGDINWDPATPVDVALQGFHPTKLCTLRTIKSDIVCGLEEGVAERIEEKDTLWKETGYWALIQFCDRRNFWLM